VTATRSNSSAGDHPPLTDDERAELERYRAFLPDLIALCERVALGDLEARLPGASEDPVLAEARQKLNTLLDITDAFVRESKAALQAASAGRFHRLVLERGLPGTFRHAASVINAASRQMHMQADALKKQQDEIARSAGGLLTASDALRDNSEAMKFDAAEASEQAAKVAASAEQLTGNMHTLAAGTEEMSLTIREIAKNASDAARVAALAVAETGRSNERVTSLGHSSAEIGKVLRIITSIAQQTRLLALNATIEAARAGVAGRGFAVVAGEVKELARETAAATEDIGRRIEAIQADTAATVASIGRIQEVVQQISELQTTIAAAVEEQTATTNEMSRNLAEGAQGTTQIASAIQNVAEASRRTSTGAATSLQAAQQLAGMAAALQQLTATATTTTTERSPGPHRLG
jgi:methyl-accepting chemotaxis protein